MFITFEGGEGTGKSTQVKLLAEYLRGSGAECVTTREPGGTEGGKAIRQLILSGSVDKWDNVTEVLLYYADRRDHLVRVVFPSLKAGKVVISDRFADSTVAYQYYGYKKEGVSLEILDKVYELVAGDFKPDITFLMDIDPERSLGRATFIQRFEKMELDFHRRLRNGYLEVAKANPDRIKIIDASQSIDEIHQEVIRHVENHPAFAK